jgi:hypothetical protein
MALALHQFPERSSFTIDELLKLSTARCARLSYKPFDGNADYDAEVSRYEKLVVSSPVHASPAEHQATPDTFSHTLGGGWDHPKLSMVTSAVGDSTGR